MVLFLVFVFMFVGIVVLEIILHNGRLGGRGCFVGGTEIMIMALLVSLSSFESLTSFGPLASTGVIIIIII